MLAAATAAAVLGNTISVSTTDLRSGNSALDNIKATWGQAISLGDKDAQLSVEYDRNENEDFLKSVSISGEAASDSDLTISYDVAHNFKSGSNDVTLTAVSSGTTLSAEYDGSEVTELSAQRELDLGGSDVDTKVTWLVGSSTARVKMMTALGDATVSAQLDIKDGESSNLEVGYETNLESGRDLTVTYTDDELELEVVDTNFEEDATWTATATMKQPELDLDDLKITLKRSWAW